MFKIKVKTYNIILLFIFLTFVKLLSTIARNFVNNMKSTQVDMITLTVPNVEKTKRHIETRFKEHRDSRKQSAVFEHLMTTGHDVSLDNVKIYANGKYDKEFLIKESLIIKNLRPDMNENVASYPLELFLGYLHLHCYNI